MEQKAVVLKFQQRLHENLHDECFHYLEVWENVHRLLSIFRVTVWLHTSAT